MVSVRMRVKVRVFIEGWCGAEEEEDDDEQRNGQGEGGAK